MIKPYYKFSNYLVDKYGEKVYKLPVNIDVTCPNRDGTKSSEGCIFCGDEGAGFECLSADLSVQEQLASNKSYIGKTYSSGKFIAYFQNYSNTYIPVDKLRGYLQDACVPGIVALYLSTRPDCVSRQIAGMLRELKAENNIDIVLELGLQTININTLRILNRHHGLAEFIDAVMIARSEGLGTCAHYITDLPWDTQDDTREGARVLSALGVDQVKLHSLYILKETRLGKMYEEGSFRPLTMEEYVERTIIFLENLDPAITVQRLLGRAPEERSLFCSWGTSWRKIVDLIEHRMLVEDRFQGKFFNYLNGSANKSI
jgi:radical SAM protein (TIGR01212 family)